MRLQCDVAMTIQRLISAKQTRQSIWLELLVIARLTLLIFRLTATDILSVACRVIEFFVLYFVR